MAFAGHSQALGATNEPWPGYSAKNRSLPRWSRPVPKCPRHGKLRKTLEKIPLWGVNSTPWHGQKARRVIWRCPACPYVVAGDAEVLITVGERKHKALKRYAEMD